MSSSRWASWWTPRRQSSAATSRHRSPPVGICGEENSLLPFADAAGGGFSRGVVLGPLDGAPTPPFVSMAVLELASPEAALEVLEAIRQAPGDRPTSAPFPRGTRTLAADPAIAETTAVVAFQGTYDEEDPNAPIDSAGVDFVTGNRLVTVDVQGGLSAEEAMAAAVDLATQQAACLASNVIGTLRPHCRWTSHILPRLGSQIGWLATRSAELRTNCRQTIWISRTTHYGFVRDTGQCSGCGTVTSSLVSR